MTAEQQKTVQIFRENFSERKEEKIIIYGTGINAEAVVTYCHEFRFVGLLDAAKNGECYWGLKVLTKEETIASGCKHIVIVARPAVHAIIYERIKAWTKEHGIGVYDIYGESVADKLIDAEKKHPYFDVNYEGLKQQIDSHEIISFDIFDTLLVRNTYEPTDVFRLIDAEIGERYSFVFSEERIKAERRLTGEPDIYSIYRELAQVCGLTQDESTFLMGQELEKELRVLARRTCMVECLSECIRMGKKVYLVSDMYLPKEILIGILEKNDIVGYEDIYISCEWGKTKQTGLFDCLKQTVCAESYLHIGDNHEADYLGAGASGIDAFEIMAPIRMLEISTYSSLLTHTDTLEKRVLLGMLAAKVFNNPFALHQSKGKPKIRWEEEFGYLFVAPLLVAFLLWMIPKTSSGEKSILLFSARDGWFVQQIYKMFVETFELSNVPKDIYFYVSRKAIFNAADKRNLALTYLNYIQSVLFGYEEIYYFDFMSKGTCQYYLQEIAGHEIKGVYVQRSYCEDARKNALEIEAFYNETSAMQKDRRLFAMCDFLECIFTSFEPSFAGMDADGKRIYEQETRSTQQLDCVKKIHDGMLEYCYLVTEIFGQMPNASVDVNFCDDILKCISGRFSDIKIKSLKGMELDDPLGNKNVGRDIFV